jgi:hypothetical protein
MSSHRLSGKDLAAMPWRNAPRLVANCAFGLFVFLALASPEAAEGPFAWWPLLRLPMPAGEVAKVGLLSMLPLVFVALGWMARRLDASRRAWQWGRPGVTWPLLGLSLLILASLDPSLTWRTVMASVQVGLMWLVYLYSLNAGVDLTVPLALVAVVQGLVAAAQFWFQTDIGLAALGELPLDPTVRGVSIIWAENQPYLRAYGLTAHPNVLGATLAMVLLLLLPQLAQARRVRLAGLIGAFALGLLGLLVSFSRASWLAFSIGAAVWLVLEVRRLRGQPGRAWSDLFGRLAPRLVIPVVLAIAFLLIHRQLVLGRFVALDVSTEAQSIRDREQFALVALQLIRAHPWRGVGAGYYVTAAREIYPYARIVASVPLLVAAELGLPGLALWVWLALSGLLGAAPAPHRTRAVPPRQAVRLAQDEAEAVGLNEDGVPTPPERAGVRGLWVAWLVASIFDVALWFTSSWRAAVLFAIVAAQVGRSAARIGAVAGKEPVCHTGDGHE